MSPFFVARVVNSVLNVLNRRADAKRRAEAERRAYLVSQAQLGALFAILVCVIIGLVLLVLTGCGPSGAPTTKTSPTPTSTQVAEPSGLSDVVPLVSVANVVDKALPSVVEITAGQGTGSGFIVSSEGIVVTNHHVVAGYDTVTMRLATGASHRGDVTSSDPDMDLAYIHILNAGRSLPALPVGDSESIRVGDEVIAIGFPIGWILGTDPTISRGIISAKRDKLLQTDAAVNPGNSGGPLLDSSGHVVGVVVARIERDSVGNPIAGINFAVPINAVREHLKGQVALVTGGTPTPFPTVEGPVDVETTKAALDELDARRRVVEEATRAAVEAQQEAARYAAALEATRVVELPTPTPVPTPTPEPTPTPLPTPTPHPSIYCQEWEALVLEWIRQGNVYDTSRYEPDDKPTPDHPNLIGTIGP